MKFSHLLTTAVFALCMIPALCDTPPQGDPLLCAMRDEAARYVREVRGSVRPYLVQLNALDTSCIRIEATLGALKSERRARQRTGRVSLHMGGYEADVEPRREGIFGGSSPSRPDPFPLVLDDDYRAARRDVWLGLETAAGGMIDDWLSLHRTAQVTSESRGCLSREPASMRLEGCVALEPCDTAVWAQKLRDLTSSLRDVSNASASLTVGVDTRYAASSDGLLSRVAVPHVELAAEVTVGTGDDRRTCKDRIVVPYLGDLPADGTLRLWMDGIADAARKPMPKSMYFGPVLLSERFVARHAFQLADFDTSSGPGVMNILLNTGSVQTETEPFPKLLSLVDDPSVRTFAGKRLMGAYAADDQGVAPRRLVLLDQGRQVVRPGTRSVSGKAERSNGHGRGILDKMAGRTGNIFLQAERGCPMAALKAELRRRCRATGRPFGIYLESDLRSVRVYLDGHEEEDDGVYCPSVLGSSVLQNVVMAGDTYAVDHVDVGEEDNIFVSAVAPALLLDTMTLVPAKSRP